MPAYAKDIVVNHCWAERCHKKAEVEVHNTHNAFIGYYCRPHGDDKVKELEENAERRRIQDEAARKKDR